MPVPETAASVDEEAARLKATLRSVLGPRTGQPADAGASSAGDGGPGHAGPEHHQHCPVCRANRYAHAVAPDLLDELGRGLAAAGRLAHDAAREMRRHTAGARPDPTHDEGES